MFVIAAARCILVVMVVVIIIVVVVIVVVIVVVMLIRMQLGQQLQMLQRFSRQTIDKLGHKVLHQALLPRHQVNNVVIIRVAVMVVVWWMIR